MVLLILIKIKTNANNSYACNGERQNKCKLNGIPQVVNIQLFPHTSLQKACVKKAKSVST